MPDVDGHSAAGEGRFSVEERVRGGAEAQDVSDDVHAETVVVLVDPVHEASGADSIDSMRSDAMALISFSRSASRPVPKILVTPWQGR